MRIRPVRCPWSALLLVSLTAALVTGCGSAPPPPSPTPTPSDGYTVREGGLAAPQLRVALPTTFTVTTSDTASAPAACQDASGVAYPCIFADVAGATNQSIVIDRDTAHTTIASLILAHYQDQTSSLNVTGAPTTPWSGTCTSIAGLTAYTAQYGYQINRVDSRSLLYVTVHDGAGYVLGFNQTGGNLDALTPIATHVVGSITFAAGPDTGAAAPSLSPSPSATPSPPASGSPSPSVTAPSPSPSCIH